MAQTVPLVGGSHALNTGGPLLLAAYTNYISCSHSVGLSLARRSAHVSLRGFSVLHRCTLLL